LALQYHQRVHRSLPLASTQPITGVPGGVAPNSAGYSWLYQILPYVAENAIYEEIRKSSHDLVLSPFDLSNVPVAGGYQSSTYSMPMFMCPSSDIVVAEKIVWFFNSRLELRAARVRICQVTLDGPSKACNLVP
jgi:hypothetical protein